VVTNSIVSLEGCSRRLFFGVRRHCVGCGSWGYWTEYVWE
jgi:hypothetical protein